MKDTDACSTGPLNNNNVARDDDAVRRDEADGVEDNQCVKLRENDGRDGVLTFN